MKKILFICLITISHLPYSCKTYSEYNSLKHLISQNTDKKIEIVPLKERYISCLETSLVKFKTWDWCIRIHENDSIREHLSKNIYFISDTEEGVLTSNCNTEGYFRGKLIIMITPFNLKIWDRKGKLVKSYIFSPAF